jgi:hypothetical protein
MHGRRKSPMPAVLAQALTASGADRHRPSRGKIDPGGIDELLGEGHITADADAEDAFRCQMGRLGLGNGPGDE